MRLIDADALYKIAWPVKDHTGRIEECVQMRDLHKAPTIDAVPVAHGGVGKRDGRPIPLFSMREDGSIFGCL